MATPSLSDPNFRQTVLLMLEHSEEGALGVVLNRPSELTVSSAIEDWAAAVSRPRVVFVGGPVSQSSVIALASVALDDVDESWSQVIGRIGTVDLECDPDEVGGLDQVRIFAGYAAWAPGQLEAELAEDAWFVLELEGSDPFSEDPNELWWQVFARQQGDLRRLRLFPRNPADN
ncbi:MAG: YqgE/AlgH family protein [Acidimicrobiaceae bacterium]|nr:YqgE/AlgH family protein [Acidimicrobiaceae bacterium]